eukprot:GHVS01043798.1.p1 GENE.GHVS01043798.1~~GHVS01043798.1.p1  ORF type:complete len:218 (+),score=38.74 GHVS01043798.1:50-703(+)
MYICIYVYVHICIHMYICTTRTYVELFDRVLKETKGSLKHHKDQTAEAQVKLEEAQGSVDDMKTKHPQQMQLLITTFENKFTQHQNDLDQQLAAKADKLSAVQSRLKAMQSDIDLFFPLFPSYQLSTSLRNSLLASTATGRYEADTSPESGVATDLKRLLTSLSSDQRKTVRTLIGPVLGLNRTPAPPPGATEAQMKQLEQENLSLREEIARLKAQN